MKIKTSEYLRDIREAEERGYQQAVRDGYRDKEIKNMRSDIYGTLNKMQDQLDEVKRSVFLERIKGKAPAKHAGEPVNEPANVGDEIAAKCF